MRSYDEQRIYRTFEEFEREELRKDWSAGAAFGDLYEYDEELELEPRSRRARYDQDDDDDE